MDLLSPVVLPDWRLLILTIVIVIGLQFISRYIDRNKRKKTVKEDKKKYHEKLAIETEGMNLQEELKLVDNVKRIRQECKELLGRDKSDNDVDESKIDAEIKKLATENRKLEDQARELEKLDKEIEDQLVDLAENYGVHVKDPQNIEQSIAELDEGLKKIEFEEHKYSEILKPYSHLTLKEDPEVDEYLESHPCLTLEFLEQAHEKFLELKASNSDRDFHEYLRELLTNQHSLEAELENLRVSKKIVDMKHRVMKEEHEKELSSFEELRVEHLFRITSARDRLEGMRERRIHFETMNEILESESETKRKQLDEAGHKYQEAEAQCSKYMQAYREIKSERERLEMERNKKLYFNQAMDLSAASSMIEDSAIPPLNDIPSIDEILRN